MPIIYPYTQYSGLWSLNSQINAQSTSNWPVPPAPYLFAWGDNVSGMLGLGNVTDISSPVQVGSTADWSVVDAGTDSSAAIKLNNTLWTWGKNSSGQLGLGNTTYYSSPKQVGSLTTWGQVESGIFHSLALIL